MTRRNRRSTKRFRQLRRSVGIVLLEGEHDLAGQQVCCFRKLL